MAGSIRDEAVRAGLAWSATLGVGMTLLPRAALGETSVAGSLSPDVVYPFALGVLAGSVITGVACGVSFALQSRADMRASEDRSAGESPAVPRPVPSAVTDDIPAVRPLERQASAASLAGRERLSALPDVGRPASGGHPSDGRGEGDRPRVLPITGHAGSRARKVEPDAAASPSPTPRRALTTAAGTSDAPARDGAQHLSSDLEDFAEHYVSRITLAERLAAKARGVREVLAERLGGDRFEGLPIIERADGSVGDVGTSWWNDRLGDSVRLVGGNVAQASSCVSAGAPARRAGAAPAPGVTPGTARGARPTDARGRRWPTPRADAVTTQDRVLATDDDVDVPLAPTAGAERDDDWNLALASMDEKISLYVPAEAPALVLSHDETPAPVLADPAFNARTYVDGIIKDEASRRARAYAQMDPTDSLHVLDSSLSLRSTDVIAGKANRRAQTEYQPRHMAKPALVENAIA
ncbi:hypothetical protein [Olsenella sp. HMSC062G07]|uniref:hypothetical protein n=1 Tax=Olsenella sp. HMSC062G07 TaxID=1739330 RepID=UPI0008A28CD5|nr:hypothetical protein [Olsenella sp. HMSC062G07]OFK24003.1 hypothetical protein HMPREF2826_08660 [Olsenella sp. HMSC062G07]